MPPATMAPGRVESRQAAIRRGVDRLEQTADGQVFLGRPMRLVAPDIAGKDIANPTSLILSAAMLLEWLARRHNKPAFAEATQKIDAAIDAAIKDAKTRTRDLGGAANTVDCGKAVAARLA